MPASIRRRLMLLVFASIALVWGVTLLSSFRHATHEVEEWEDARLAEFAQTLVLLDQNDLTALSNTQIDARDEFAPHAPHGREKDDDELPRDILFQVRTANGSVLAGSPGLVSLHAWQPPPNAASGARTMTFGGQLWHTYTLHDASTGRTVRVMEPANTRSDLATGAARRISRPIAFALPILALLVWISVGHSLAPLKTLSKAIRARDVSQLEPIDIGQAPMEVRPLIDAINHLLSRLRQSIQRERAFTSDAAHELKTPLAAIKVQAQVALVTQDIALQRLAMERVVQGVDRSAHLAEQLLLLARLDEHERIPAAPVALEALASETLAAAGQDLQNKAMSVALLSAAPLEIAADPILVRILLDNLIDNAIKYGNPGGRIEVEISRAAHDVLLTVRDNGPGVAAEERTRLADRFFRGTGTNTSGSGLGLSIVARIVEYFGAQLRFDSGIAGRGLAVKITFPGSQAVRSETASVGEP